MNTRYSRGKILRNTPSNSANADAASLDAFNLGVELNSQQGRESFPRLIQSKETHMASFNLTKPRGRVASKARFSVRSNAAQPAVSAAQGSSKLTEYVGFINNDVCNFVVVLARNPVHAKQMICENCNSSDHVQVQLCNWFLISPSGRFLDARGHLTDDLDAMAIYSARPEQVAHGINGRWILDNTPSTSPRPVTHLVTWAEIDAEPTLTVIEPKEVA